MAPDAQPAAQPQPIGGHVHSHGGGGSPASRARLWATFFLTATVMLTEATGGWMCGALALWADAGHVLFDLLALGVVLLAQSVARRPADSQRTFGYGRWEVLAALANGVAVLVIAVLIAHAALGRWANPHPIAVGPMMAVAAVSLATNIASLTLLGGAHGHTHHDLNLRGTFLHVLGDALSAVAVIVGGGIIMATGYLRVDALLSWGIAAILIFGAMRLMRDVVDVLLESAPASLDTLTIQRALVATQGVQQVRALHVWSITHGMVALTAHVQVAPGVHDIQALCVQLQQMLQSRFGLSQVTLQLLK